MAAQQKGIFPNMTIPDIIEVLNTWGLNASPEQLNRPTPDFLESIYTACLQAVTGLSLPLLHEPTQNALDAYGTEDRELYSKALSHNLLMFHLQVHPIFHVELCLHPCPGRVLPWLVASTISARQTYTNHPNHEPSSSFPPLSTLSSLPTRSTNMSMNKWISQRPS